MYSYANSNDSTGVSIDDSNSLLYAAHVFDPERAPPSRIPSLFPINTAIMHRDIILPLSTDASGNTYIKFTPHLVTSASNGIATYAILPAWNPSAAGVSVAASDTLIGASFSSANEGRAVRLVAAKIKLRYVGAEFTRSGFFFASHDFNMSNLAGLNFAPTLSGMQDNPVFELQTTVDGIEIIYKPYDNSYLEFSKTNSGSADATVYRPYTIIAGLIGGQVNTACVLAEVFWTIEYIPGPVEQDIVETQPCKGNPSVISDLPVRDLIRPALNEGGRQFVDYFTGAAGSAWSGLKSIGKTIGSGGVASLLGTGMMANAIRLGLQFAK